MDTNAMVVCSGGSFYYDNRLLHRRESFSRTRTAHKKESSSSTRLSMVRNSDLPECLVFYGDDFWKNNDDDDVNDDTLSSLLQECQEVGTAVVAITSTKNHQSLDSSTFPSGLIYTQRVP